MVSVAKGLQHDSMCRCYFFHTSGKVNILVIGQEGKGEKANAYVLSAFKTKISYKCLKLFMRDQLPKTKMLPKVCTQTNI